MPPCSHCDGRGYDDSEQALAAATEAAAQGGDACARAALAKVGAPASASASSASSSSASSSSSSAAAAGSGGGSVSVKNHVCSGSVCGGRSASSTATGSTGTQGTHGTRGACANGNKSCSGNSNGNDNNSDMTEVYPFDTSLLDKLLEFGYERGHILQTLERLYNAGRARSCSDISRVMDMLLKNEYDPHVRVQPLRVERKEPSWQSRLKAAVDDATQAKERLMCQICYENDIKVVIVPCGHVMCQDCGSACKQCFICAQPVKEMQVISSV